MVDKDIVQRKLAFIDQRLQKLDILKTMNINDFLTSFQAIDSSKYNLQVCIEAIIDISQHVVARERWGVPDTSADAIRFLVKQGMVGKSLEPSLVQMVKFRNRIVHLYLEVNDNEIYRILQENLDDIKEFVNCIVKKYF